MQKHHGPTVYADWRHTVTFGDQGPAPRDLIKSDGIKAVLVGLKAGQAVPHHASTEAVYHFIDGTGTMAIDHDTIPVEAGATIVVADVGHRCINATTDLVFLGTRPSDAHREQQAHEGQKSTAHKH